MPRPFPNAPPPQPIQYSQLTPEDFSDPARVNKLNGMLTQIINAVNAGTGATGRTILPAGIDVQGATISGLGAPKSPSDAVSAAHAESNYGAPALAPQLDIGGANALKGLTGLWSKVLALQKQIVSAGVRSLNGLTGALNLVAGSSNVTINPSGSDIAISVSATGGGIDELTGDVNAGPGSGTVDATVVGINGASIPASEPYVGTNADGQIVAAATPQSGITQLTGDVTAGPGSGSQAAQVVATHLAAPLPVAQGGSGTATPSLVAGANVTVSGTWPNQTVAATGGAAGVASLNSLTGALSLVAGSNVTITPSGSNITIAASGGGGHSYEGWGNLQSIAALTKLSGASANITLTDGALSSTYSWTASGSNTIQLAYESAPTPPWNYYLRFLGGGFATNVQFGLVVRSSSSGKLTIIAFNSGTSLTIQEWNSPTSFSSSLSVISNPFKGPAWLKLSNDGTNLSFSYGYDGLNWLAITTRALSAFMIAADQIGLGGVPQSSGIAWVYDFGDVTPS